MHPRRPKRGFCLAHSAYKCVSLRTAFQVFSRCNSLACIPAAAVPMIDYWLADKNMTAYVPATPRPDSQSKGEEHPAALCMPCDSNSMIDPVVSVHHPGF